MGKKSSTVTVKLPSELRNEVYDCCIGDECLFNSFSEFGNAAMHWYYEQLILFVYYKNKEIDEQIKSGSLISTTSKLGMIYRHLFTDKYWTYSPEDGTKTESIRITGGFAKELDIFIKSTGFFHSKAEFCLNAIGAYHIVIDHCSVFSLSFKEKQKDFFNSASGKEIANEMTNPAELINKKIQFTGICKSDKLDWLD